MGVRESIALVLLIAAFALGWYSGSLSGRLGKASRAAEVALTELDKIKDGQDALQKKLDKLPRSEGKIREIVRESPSGCVLPPDVVAGLREAVREANRARALPANP